MNRPITATLIVLPMFAYAMCGDASAATRNRSVTSQAVALCQSALPAYEGKIRKRPLAVQNEGTSAAFVTCAFINDNGASGTKRAYAYFVNVSSVARQVSCTLVTGVSFAPQIFVVKSIDLPAHSSGDGIAWESSLDNTGGVNFSNWVALSCNLPPGTGIGHLGSAHDDDVGA